MSEQPETEEPTAQIGTRVELLLVQPGKVSPVVLDVGSEPVIVIQPDDLGEENADTLALSVVVGGGLDAELVAWILGQASEAMVNGIRANLLEKP